MAQSATLLKTFVHISDLHIGEIDPRTGDAAVSPQAGLVLQNFRGLDGLIGHHGRALKELTAFCQKLHDSGEAFEVLVTGDLTRSGAASEIGVVQQFLAARVDLHPPAGNEVGLQLSAVPPASITGNHDQWGGRNFPVGGGPLAPCTLVPNKMPYVLVRPLTNGRRLVMAGIDTDANVSRFSLKRLFANGSFQSQLPALEQILPAREPGDIRVLLAHHSLTPRGLILRMDAPSKVALLRFLADQEFTVLLSGHTHVQLFTPNLTSTRGASSTIQELTCGSTTQHDQAPYHWRTLLGRSPKVNWTPNTLLVHRLYAAPGYTTWNTQAYVRMSYGFASLGAPGSRVFPV